MLKKAVWSVALVSLFALSLHEARAQSDEKKFEVGGQFSLLRLPTRTVTGITPAESRVNGPGLGGRFGYNFSKYFALEAEGNFFPRDRDVEGGRKIQGLFGVKAGKRFEKVGVFAKARPGFIRFDAGDTMIRLGARNVAATQPAFPAVSPFHLVVIPVSAETTHNLQASVGFGFRF